MKLYRKSIAMCFITDTRFFLNSNWNRVSLHSISITIKNCMNIAFCGNCVDLLFSLIHSKSILNETQKCFHSYFLQNIQNLSKSLDIFFLFFWIIILVNKAKLPKESYFGFPQSLWPNDGIVPRNRPLPPSKSFPAHHYNHLFISFSSYTIETASLNNQSINLQSSQ